MNLSNSRLGSSVSITLVFLLLLLLPFDLFFRSIGLRDFAALQLGDILKNTLIVAYGFVLIRRLGFSKISGLSRLLPRRPILLIVPLYFVLLGPLWYSYFGYGFQDVSLYDTLLFFGAMISVGISEEIIFRGVVLPNLIKGSGEGQSILVPLIGSSVLFGVLHLLNLVKPDVHFTEIIAQVIYATFFGIAFGIVLLRSESLVPLGVLHGLINFANGFERLPGAVKPPEMENLVVFEAVFAVLIVIPFLGFTLRQLPALERSEILSRFEN